MKPRQIVSRTEFRSFVSPKAQRLLPLPVRLPCQHRGQYAGRIVKSIYYLYTLLCIWYVTLPQPWQYSEPVGRDGAQPTSSRASCCQTSTLARAWTRAVDVNHQPPDWVGMLLLLGWSMPATPRGTLLVFSSSRLRRLRSCRVARPVVGPSSEAATSSVGRRTF